jgi:hypothetical protein
MEQQFHNECSTFRLEGRKLKGPRRGKNHNTERSAAGSRSVSVLDEVTSASKTFLKDKGGTFFERQWSKKKTISKVESSPAFDSRNNTK